GSIEAIVVGTGPGGFTGLRVGVATARGLAEALGVPLYGVESLLVLAAATATARVGERVWGAIDARRGEYFVQPFMADAAGHITTLEPASAIAVAELRGLDGITVGDDHDAVLASLAIAGLQAFETGQAAVEGAGAGDPLTVLPDYVRGPDAEPARMDVHIDRLQGADLGALDIIERRCFPHPWSMAMYAEELRRGPDDGVHLAARDRTRDERLVGAALAARIGDSWHIMNVLVDPSARRRGIAARLVEELLRQTTELGVDEGWTLEVRTANAGAIALYERLGFVHRGTRRGYYTDTGEDALVMWRNPAHVGGAVAAAPSVTRGVNQ
ncbi:MAG: tRNA (adenosine(37)-N6)-threonylcarbamoyltransferase complex dimerization subunit type 1 TsaB, partial [Thermoleophilia bacterium]|nr:tRNA (adenosine(37)-N6)-threonylcarbamoyltransferase complex dimerization subunit type 1 TsaB [Thermoleophilia bacterium]